MQIYTTLCPGCNLGCGLYLRENESELDIDFRKNSPVNAGKLCRFGVNLPGYYQPVTTTVDGKPADLDEAVNRAAEVINEHRAHTAFISAGSATCEEHLAVMKLAEHLDTTVNTGMGAYSGLPAETHPTLGVGIPLADIEDARHIVLFIDPYTQYPLLIRTLLRAKKKGARITAIGYKELPLADENLPITTDYTAELDPGEGAVLISELHPHSRSEELARQLNLAEKTGASIMFLKPFVNATGTHLLSKHTQQQSLQQMIEAVNTGDIKVLYCLETDPLEIMLREDEAREALGKLDALILQTGRRSTACEMADIVIAVPPLYQKQGTLVNVEGRVMENSGTDTTGIDVMDRLLSATGGSGGLTYDALHSEVLKELGIKHIDEYSIPAYTKPEYSEIQTEAPEPITETALVTLFTPFTWTALPDDDFVELNLKMARELKLRKGGMVNLSNSKGSINKKFKISRTHENIILTREKLLLIENTADTVEAMRV